MAIIAIPVVILFAMFGGFYNDTAEFRAQVEKEKAEHTSCEWKYVGKKDVDPSAIAIPLKPPVGNDYVLWKHTCEK